MQTKHLNLLILLSLFSSCSLTDLLGKRQMVDPNTKSETVRGVFVDHAAVEKKKNVSNSTDAQLVALKDANKNPISLYQCYAAIWPNNLRSFVLKNPLCHYETQAPMIQYYDSGKNKGSVLDGQIISMTTSSYHDNEMDVKTLESLEHAFMVTCKIDSSNSELMSYKFMGCRKVPLFYFE